MKQDKKTAAEATPTANGASATANASPMQNPKAALDAICVPSELTISKIALLERIQSPVIFGNTDDTVKNIVALYAITQSPAEVLKHLAAEDVEAAALAWADGITPSSFALMLAKMLDAISAFWKMLPRPEEETADGDGTSKKGDASETASSRS